MNKRTLSFVHRLAVVEENSQIWILVWCRLLYWLMQFNKLIKNQLHSCRINQYKSSSLYFWEGLQLYVSGYSCIFRATAVCFGLQLYVSGYSRVFWATAVCFGLQLYISGYSRVFRGYSCMFRATAVCFGLQLYVSGYRCIFRAIAVCFGLQLYVSGYSCMFRATAVCFGLQLYALGYSCMFRATAVCFWLQLYVSGYSCMFRLVLNFLKAIPYVWCKALNGTVHFTIKYGPILGKNERPLGFSTNRDVSLLILLRKIAY